VHPTRRTFAPWKPPTPPSPEPTMTVTASPTLAVNAASLGSASGGLSTTTLTAVIVMAVLMPIITLVVYYFFFSDRAKAAKAAKDKARAAKEFMLRTIAEEEEALERGRGRPGGGGGGGGTTSVADSGRVSVDDMRISLHEFYASKGNTAARVAAATRKHDRRNSALPTSASASASPPAASSSLSPGIGFGLEMTRPADFASHADAFSSSNPIASRRISTRGGLPAAEAAATPAAAEADAAGRRYKFQPPGTAAAHAPPTPPTKPKPRAIKSFTPHHHTPLGAMADAEHKWEY
jgi:hypothetical protein